MSALSIRLVMHLASTSPSLFEIDCHLGSIFLLVVSVLSHLSLKLCVGRRYSAPHS
jgi:hypothetical protein